MGLRKFFKRISYLTIFAGFGLIIFSSAINIYENREKVIWIINRKLNLEKMMTSHNHPRGLVNPLEISKRQIPPKKIEDLTILEDANIKGQWSAPFDWNVTSIHSVYCQMKL